MCAFSGLANFQPPPEHSHSVMHGMHAHCFSCMVTYFLDIDLLMCRRTTRREAITAAAHRWTARPPRSKGGVTKRRRRRRRPRLLLPPRPRQACRGSGRRTRTSWTSPAWTTRPPRESLPSTTERRPAGGRAWWATNQRSAAAREWCTQHKYEL